MKLHKDKKIMGQMLMFGTKQKQPLDFLSLSLYLVVSPHIYLLPFSLKNVLGSWPHMIKSLMFLYTSYAYRLMTSFNFI